MHEREANMDFEGYKQQQAENDKPHISTKERLARVCESNGLPLMAEKARRGDYDDYESTSATPCMDLVRDFLQAECLRLADRAKDGEWDGTKEEADAWMKREGNAWLRGA